MLTLGYKDLLVGIWEANETKQGEEGRHRKTLVMFMCHESFSPHRRQQEPQGLCASNVTLIDCDDRAKRDNSG